MKTNQRHTLGPKRWPCPRAHHRVFSSLDEKPWPARFWAIATTSRSSTDPDPKWWFGVWFGDVRANVDLREPELQTPKDLAKVSCEAQVNESAQFSRFATGKFLRGLALSHGGQSEALEICTPSESQSKQMVCKWSTQYHASRIKADIRSYLWFAPY